MKDMYRLKPGQESFDIVDGPDAGARFKREGAYSAKEIPAAEMGRFEIIPEVKAEAAIQKKKAKEVKPASAEASAGEKGGDKK